MTYFKRRRRTVSITILPRLFDFHVIGFLLHKSVQNKYDSRVASVGHKTWELSAKLYDDKPGLRSDGFGGKFWIECKA